MIILNDKDADYVINICKKKLESVEISYHETFSKMMRMHEASQSILDNVRDNDTEDSIDRVEAQFEAAKEKMTSDYEQIKNEYKTIIKLMSCGSDKLGE